MNSQHAIIRHSKNPERYTNLHSEMLFLLFCENVTKGNQMCRLPSTVTCIQTGCGVETSGPRGTQWQELQNSVINLQVPYKVDMF